MLPSSLICGIKILRKGALSFCFTCSSRRQLILNNANPLVRPFFVEVANRVRKIMEEHCPEIANYDAGVEKKFQEMKEKQEGMKHTSPEEEEGDPSSPEKEPKKATAEKHKKISPGLPQNRAKTVSLAAENAGSGKTEPGDAFQEFQAAFSTKADLSLFSQEDIPLGVREMQQKQIEQTALVRKFSREILGAKSHRAAYIDVLTQSPNESTPLQTGDSPKQAPMRKQRKPTQKKGDSPISQKRGVGQPASPEDLTPATRKDTSGMEDAALMSLTKNTWNRQLGALIGQFVVSHSRGQGTPRHLPLPIQQLHIPEIDGDRSRVSGEKEKLSPRKDISSPHDLDEQNLLREEDERAKRKYLKKQRSGTTSDLLIADFDKAPHIESLRHASCDVTAWKVCRYSLIYSRSFHSHSAPTGKDAHRGPREEG